MASTEPAEKVLTRWERLWFGFMANRKRIGLWVFGVSTLVRGSLFITNADHTADLLKFFSEILMLTGGTTAVTGATQGDEHYAAKKEQVVQERVSGEYPAFNPEAKK